MSAAPIPRYLASRCVISAKAGIQRGDTGVLTPGATPKLVWGCLPEQKDVSGNTEQPERASIDPRIVKETAQVLPYPQTSLGVAPMSKTFADIEVTE